MCETKSVTSALYLNDPEETMYVTNVNTGKDEPVKKGNLPEFVGRVGQFCPIKPGCGGKELLREGKDKDGNVKYGAATGTKGYYWLESEVVKNLGKEGDIDRSYYDKMVDTAVETISKYGDFEWFVSDDTIKKPNLAECHDCPAHQDDHEPWLLPCGDRKYETCFDCPHFNNDMFDIDCGQGYDISNVIISTKK